MVTRKDIEHLFDRGSFMEMEKSRGSSVVTGYGRIGDRMVYAFLQDSEKEGGAFSVAAASKIIDVYKLALKAKVPVVGLLDSTGYLIDEGAEALNAFSEVYAFANTARESILQIMIVGGKCMGQMVSLASTADFFFRDMEMSEAFEKTKELIKVMPPAKGILPEQFDTSDDLNRLNTGIEKLVDSGRDVLKEISDDGFLLETDQDKAPELTTGFIKINGLMVAAMANNKTEKGSRVSLEGLDKARKLVETAGKFKLGLVKISNTEGIALTEDQNMMVSASGKLWDAFTKAKVPMIDVISSASSLDAVVSGFSPGSALPAGSSSISHSSDLRYCFSISTLPSGETATMIAPPECSTISLTDSPPSTVFTICFLTLKTGPSYTI